MKITEEYSGVHVPIDIYDKGKYGSTHVSLNVYDKRYIWCFFSSS